jgi:hypothetical protein
MKKPARHLQLLYAKRAKKKARRKALLKERNKKEHLELVQNAPRWMRRQRELVGSTYWRGDRRVLENYVTRGCQ